MLNGLNNKSGTRLEVAAADQALLTPATFSAATQKFGYRVNPAFGTPTATQVTLTQQFQMQVGVRYSF